MGLHTEISHRSLSLLARLLPPGVAFLIGETFAGAFYLLSPARRGVIRRNLTVALGSERTDLWRMGFRLMLSFGRGVAETLMLPRLSPEDLAHMIEVSGKERIDSVLESGRGLILVTAHIGSWEMGGAALAAMGYSMTTVAGIQFTPTLSPYIRRTKQHLGIDVVSYRSGARRIVQALSKGGIAALHMDGDQFVGGVETEFFGRRTRLPAGPAALAVRTGAAILPAFAIRTGKSRIRVFIEEEVFTGDKDEAAITRRIVAVVEDYIRRYPDQWCVFRPIWGTDR
jgi:KDO2-lipid IV(A) lauroyltransferase